MVRMKRKLGKVDMVVFISSMKFKTMASIENDKGERRGQDLRFPRADRRLGEGVTYGC